MFGYTIIKTKDFEAICDGAEMISERVDLITEEVRQLRATLVKRDKQIKDLQQANKVQTEFLTGVKGY